ncbi:MAG: putative ABC transporter permease [Oscillospiraceae bacterium]
MQTFYELVIYFVLFSFCGWVCESIFCSINEKKVVNRGFLNGPVCPVYGFGGLIVVYVLAPFQHHIALLFLFGMIATTILEYITSLNNLTFSSNSSRFHSISQTQQSGCG